MSDEMNTKMRKKVDNIISLQTQIRKWEEKSEEEIGCLIKELEKIPRDEVSSYYIPYFTDNDFAGILLRIVGFYPNNQKIILNIISLLGNMVLRYGLLETAAIYRFISDHSESKGLSAYVAIYLPRMKGFGNRKDKWEYFISIQTMTPKKVSHPILVGIIQENINNIPCEYQEKVIRFLQEKYHSANNEYGKKMYSDMINKIRI